MTDYLLPPIAAVLLWWAGTGIVIVLDRLPGSAHRWSFLLMSALSAAALGGIAATRGTYAVGASYAAFFGAIVVWGWHELAFLSGWITGPRQRPATPGAHWVLRLREAVGVLLWHELALLLTGAALWWWLLDSPNRTAAWTFTLLYVMRVSAKVNLYLGVRNLGLDFLPPHLAYLGSYFRRARFNALMPLSLAGGALIVGALLLGAADTTGGLRAMHLLLASMLALALVEHLMMVLPVQPSALWAWALREPATS